jgi:hypothetical protein
LDGGDGTDFLYVLSHAHVLGVGWCGLRFVSDHHLPHGLGGRGNGLLCAHWTALEAAKYAALAATHRAAFHTAFETTHGAAHWTTERAAHGTAQCPANRPAFISAICSTNRAALFAADRAALESTFETTYGKTFFAAVCAA